MQPCTCIPAALSQTTIVPAADADAQQSIQMSHSQNKQAHTPLSFSYNFIHFTSVAQFTHNTC